VVWSQDAILHSGRRTRVLEEVARVLKSGGEFVFTDPMQADDCPAGVLGPVLARIHLDSLGSMAFYREHLSKLGFSERDVVNLTPQLGCHYGRVRQELSERYEAMCRLSTPAYVDRMIGGLGNWVAAEASGHLAWGILHFQAQ
jgi:sarcosine/dimethylglycine N-methyltransferase